jgi:hypothetical protein
MSVTDCMAGDTCKMEPGGYGICEHPKADGGTLLDGSTGDDGGTGSDGGGSDATTD